MYRLRVTASPSAPNAYSMYVYGTKLDANWLRAPSMSVPLSERSKIWRYCYLRESKQLVFSRGQTQIYSNSFIRLSTSVYDLA